MSTKDNKALVRRYVEQGLDRHDFAVIESLLATPPEHRAAHRQARERNWAASPDWQYRIEDMIAEGDRVAVRVTAGGTHQHDWPTPLGVAPATGRRITTSWIAFFRVAEGRIVEQWSVSDALGQAQQLGVLPTPAVLPAHATTDE